MNKYQSYKSTDVEWIGKIPEHWGLRKLTHISDYVNCGYTSTPEYVDDGVMFLSGQNVKNGKIDYTKFNYISEELHNELTKRIKPQIGDLLVVRVGGHSNIGMSCVVDTSVDFSIYVSLTLVRLKNTICSSYFLNFILNNDRFREFCLVETKIGGGVGNLNVKDFERFQFPLPPLQEQQRIVEFLDDKTGLIDKLISIKERKISLLKEQLTSIINQVVTKGLNPNVKMKDSGVEWIGEIPEHWIKCRLKNISTSVNGYSFKSDDFDREYDIPVIRIGDVGDIIDFEDCVKVKSKFLEEKKDYIIRKDDILIGLTGGTIGKSGRYNYEIPSLLNQRVGLLRNKNEVLNGLLYHYVKSEVFIRYIFYDCYGGGQDNISMNDILNMIFPLPPIHEQNQIVEYLHSKTKEIDDLVQLEQKKIDLLKEYRQSLISEVVTGKIKVTTDE